VGGGAGLGCSAPVVTIHCVITIRLMNLSFADALHEKLEDIAWVEEQSSDRQFQCYMDLHFEVILNQISTQFCCRCAA
jgi:hypothetical protein